MRPTSDRGAFRRGRTYLALGLLAFLVLSAGGAVRLAGFPQMAVAETAPDFSLTDQYGQNVSLSDFAGRPVVLTFLYTHCPDLCPLVLARLSQTFAGSSLAGLPEAAVVVVTVDPARDTVERLREFSASWDSRWTFLTGSSAQVGAVWASYNVFVERSGEGLHPDQHDFEVIHSSLLELIDRKGLVAAKLQGEWTPSELAAALRQAQATETTASGPLRGGWAGSFLRRCGEFAVAHPATFLGLAGLLALPGLVLGGLLLRAFLASPAPQGQSNH